MKRKAGMVWVATLLLAVAAQPGQAQDNGSASGKTIWDGVYSAEQATTGERVAQQNCVSCHSPTTEWAHPSFIAAWAGRSIGELREHIQATMPFDRPGALSAQEYTDIVAYMLKLGSVPAGEEALPAEHEALEKIEVTRRVAGSQ